jgi:hypothetical protein
MDINTFKRFLAALRDEGCLLTGSFARHTNDLGDHVSDIDLVCGDRTEDDFGEMLDAPIERCIDVFEKFDVPWESAVIGSIGSPRDLVTLPRPVEIMESSWASYRWEPPAGNAIHVYGVLFKTFTPTEE